MPTENQKAAVKDTLDNLRKGKKISMRQILLKNGYSKAVANQPHFVTKSKGWQELMEEMLPDSLLSKVHKQLVNKKEKIVLGAGKGYSEIADTGQPHSDALKAVEMGYKLKGRFIERTDITSGGKPIIIFDEDAANKYAITPSPKTDSERPAQIQDSSLRTEIRKDDTSG